MIDVDNYCCDVEWDNVCQLTYDYCQGTWSGPLPARIPANEIYIYPNPTKGIVNINKKVDLKVFNNLGDVIISKNNTNAIDVSKMSPGIYNIQIKHNNNIINKKIIKK